MTTIYAVHEIADVRTHPNHRTHTHECDHNQLFNSKVRNRDGMSAWQHRRNDAGGTMKLTERELRLVPMPEESTVTLLNIEWDASSDQPQPEALPDWLDDRKLVELGFDGSVPLTHPLAGRYYRSMSPEQEFNDLLMPGQPLLRGQCQRGFDQRHIDARLMRGPPGRPSRRL